MDRPLGRVAPLVGAFVEVFLVGSFTNVSMNYEALVSQRVGAHWFQRAGKEWTGCQVVSSSAPYQ